MSDVPLTRSTHPRGGLYFEDFEIGMVLFHRLIRTVAQTDNMLFSDMTLNPQPLHSDAHLCATETEFARPPMNSPLLRHLWVGCATAVTRAGGRSVRGDTRRACHDVRHRRELACCPARPCGRHCGRVTPFFVG
jgi:acyl dehydratase